MSDDRLILPCGQRLDDLTEQVFDGAEPGDRDHQATCPHCQAALGHIRAVEADARGIATERVEVPAGLARQVMARLRAAPGLLTVAVTEAGTTEVAEGVVASVAREAAMRVSGVQFASAFPGGRSGDGLSGLRMRLVVDYGPSLHALADAVRDRVRRETASRTGVQIDHIHVSIDDLA